MPISQKVCRFHPPMCQIFRKCAGFVPGIKLKTLQTKINNTIKPIRGRYVTISSSPQVVRHYMLLACEQSRLRDRHHELTDRAFDIVIGTVRTSAFNRVSYNVLAGTVNTGIFCAWTGYVRAGTRVGKIFMTYHAALRLLFLFLLRLMFLFLLRDMMCDDMEHFLAPL